MDRAKIGEMSKDRVRNDLNKHHVGSAQLAAEAGHSEAVRLARLAAAAGLPRWVKLEIHPDPHYLLPDPIETLKAAEILVQEELTVLPYINADPVLAKRLQDVGTATVMPLGSPIGSNRGLETRGQIEIITRQAAVPVVVDAGIGAPVTPLRL